ncbi:carbon-nitrogen hydrolase family protein [Cohnella hashimotonis]|uniref:Carbon-nitrogen hydrolase family protein n=1 Tax=Cohnella hashimotonis TaxID=2826895 RepID=A0ABT6TVK5_9BACL|nr:carbon-nitrogen hydrolase family protein [Cohnella hashimotonis]MDI4649827.1 carbon-nitrogen hydrolase family protein [Cohnella hashimotonis]
MTNRMPPPGAAGWQTWAPHEALAPIFDRDMRDGESVLIIRATGSPNAYGKWIGKTAGVEGRKTYDIAADYLATGIDAIRADVYALVTWSDANGALLTRDYIDQSREALPDGWIGLRRTMTAPAGAAFAELELAFRWSASGEVAWRRPSVAETAATAQLPIRTVRVATTLINKFSGSRTGNLADMSDLLDQAGAQRADIVCLSEGVYEQGVGGRGYGQFGEPIPGAFTNFLASHARKHRYYVIASLFETDGDVLYNTAVLIDRDGRISGKYRKTHLPLFEAEMGVTPGSEYPVFDTDFGRIGILICWDSYFPEPARLLALKGAELLFVPTQGNARIQSLARAVDNGVHVVVAGMWEEKPSRIVDPRGDVLAELSEEAHGVAVAEIDLGKPFYKNWLSVGDADGEARSLFRRERRPSTYGDLTI